MPLSNAYTADQLAQRCAKAEIEIDRLREKLRQIAARARAIPGDDLKELQRQMAHIASLANG